MALEVLEDVKTLAGFDVRHAEHMPFDSALKSDYILIDHIENMISFKIQKGPIKEVGTNGCQIDAILHTYREILVGLNEKYPCSENKLTIAHLDKAIAYQEQRTRNRKARGVEGLNKE